ncbi:unnamed protein product [Trichobilharzia szidati]|nr:unnamed protein product [Trichobilharzia szidati]
MKHFISSSLSLFLLGICFVQLCSSLEDKPGEKFCEQCIQSMGFFKKVCKDPKVTDGINKKIDEVCESEGRGGDKCAEIFTTTIDGLITFLEAHTPTDICQLIQFCRT